MSLPLHLWEIKQAIEGYARDYGLDFFETIFEVIDYQTMNEIAAFGGFPTRYPHWRFGMEYEQLSKSHEYGLGRIYEMVINNDPAYAYLLEGNNLVDQKTVIAHVYGHADFFKHNFYFSKTNRKMVDQMANHATRVRRLIDRLGQEKVEDFIDTCLSLDNLIDYYAPFIARPPARISPEEEEQDDPEGVPKLPSRDYMDPFINPPEYIEQQRKKIQDEKERRKKLPVNPQRDVLLFLMEYAPLESWELDILNIIRAEAYYFAPQGMTKIMNEGWATYWHSRILCERALGPDEFIEYARVYAGVVATSPKKLNPYKLGVELWRDIQERWDKGMFGEEWENCEDMAARESWDREVGAGMDKLFEARTLYNDITFLDTFLTRDFIERQELYSFGYDPKRREWVIDSREFDDVKRKILDGLTNFGHPFIEVVDANFRNRSELLMRHRFLGTPLDVQYANEVLTNLHRVWKRPVYIETELDGKPRLLGFDGQTHHNDAWDGSDGEEESAG